MAYGRFKRVDVKPEEITKRMVQTSDIEKLKDKYRVLCNHYKRNDGKPVLLFVGDSGVGKSSCIATILNLNQQQDAEKLKRMNISVLGAMGTTEVCEVEGEHLVCIDTRGKKREETGQQYTEYIERVVEQRKIDMALIVGVVRADEQRDQDIDSIMESLKTICTLYQKPFLILMNQFDRIMSFERFANREARLIQLGKQIDAECTRLLFHNFSLNNGVFAVAARPTRQIPNACPRAEPSKDVFDIPHQYKVLCPGIGYCYKCNEADIAMKLMDLKDPELFAETKKRLVEEKHATIHEIEAGDPIGLKIDDPAINIIRNVLDHPMDDNEIRMIVSKFKDQLKSIPNLINACVQSRIYVVQCRIYSQKTARELDKQICERLAERFDLETTGFTQGDYEFTRWEKAQEEWRARGLVRFISRDHVLDYYLAAWGVHYALKFHDIAVTIMSGFAKNEPTDALEEECRRVLEGHPEENVEKYMKQMIEDQDIKKSCEKLLVHA